VNKRNGVNVEMMNHSKVMVLRGGPTASLKSKGSILLPFAIQKGVHFNKKEKLYGQRGSIH
jgi:hypothetical protein